MNISVKNDSLTAGMYAERTVQATAVKKETPAKKVEPRDITVTENNVKETDVVAVRTSAVQSKMNEIMRDNKTGVVIVKSFDHEGTQVTQRPPEQYMKNKELQYSTGQYIDKTV